MSRIQLPGSAGRGEAEAEHVVERGWGRGVVVRLVRGMLGSCNLGVMIWRVRSALPVWRCEEGNGMERVRIACVVFKSMSKDQRVIYHQTPMQLAVTNGETLHRTTFRHDISVLTHEERGKRHSNHRSPPNHSKTKLTS